MIDTWNRRHNIYSLNYRFIVGNLIIIKHPKHHQPVPSQMNSHRLEWSVRESLSAQTRPYQLQNRETHSTPSANEQLTCSVSHLSACALTCEPLTAGGQRERALLHRQLVEFSELWRQSQRCITLQSKHCICKCYMGAKSLLREFKIKNLKRVSYIRLRNGMLSLHRVCLQNTGFRLNTHTHTHIL